MGARRLAELYRRQAELALEIADAYDAEEPRVPALSYTSESLPPDCPTRRAFAEWLRRKRPAGAALEGRTWSVPKDAWHASRRKNRPALVRHAKPQDVEDALAERAIAAAGMRRTA